MRRIGGGSKPRGVPPATGQLTFAGSDMTLWWLARSSGWEPPAEYLCEGVQLHDGWQASARSAVIAAAASTSRPR